MLGHFPREVGHNYWERLIQNTPRLAGFRKLFGDENMDYGEALKTHYAKPASNNWKQNFISANASAHPWEDWAKNWAHYLHIIDKLETGYSFALTVNPRVPETEAEMNALLNIDLYKS